MSPIKILFFYLFSSTYALNGKNIIHGKKEKTQLNIYHLDCFKMCLSLSGNYFRYSFFIHQFECKRISYNILLYICKASS